MNDTKFKVFVGGEEVEFEIKEASLEDQRESQKVYNQAFSDAIKSGCIVRGRLEQLLKDQNLWSEDKDRELAALQTKVSNQDKILAKGGISLKQAKNIAMNMRDLRDEMKVLVSSKTNLDSHTAEGQADNARFNYLVSVCVVYTDTKKPYFNTYLEYLNNSSSDVGVVGANKLASIMYGLDSDYEKKLPENKFLLQYRLVNDKLDYIDEKGRTTDSEGRLVNKNGRYINEKDEFVDKNGDMVSIEGDYVVDFEPFLDPMGKPITLDNNDQQNKKDTTE